MSNISEKQLMEAVKDLKSWCRQHRVLVGECKCPFNDGGVCSISDVDMPCEIKVPCRWTEDDYNLAKLLKNKGAEFIERVKYEVIKNPVKWLISNRCPIPNNGLLPNGFFESLGIEEKVSLDDVIKEYEERL